MSPKHDVKLLICLPNYGSTSPRSNTCRNFWRRANLENALMTSKLGCEKHATGGWGVPVAQQRGRAYNIDATGACVHVPPQPSRSLLSRPDQPRNVADDPLPGLPDVATAVSNFPGGIYKPTLTWTRQYFNLSHHRPHQRRALCAARGSRGLRRWGADVVPRSSIVTQRILSLHKGSK